MSSRIPALLLTFIAFGSCALAQKATATNPTQAATYAAQAIAALTEGVSITDVTLTGTARPGPTRLPKLEPRGFSQPARSSHDGSAINASYQLTEKSDE
jgi:hypothetical protein